MVPVQIVGLRIDPVSGVSAVVLGESAHLTRVLPIMIGAFEAQSIADSLNGVTPPRPLTHDLTVALLLAAGSRVDEVAVTELRDGVFFAEIFVESALGMTSVSARPSDAIAIAVRVGAPIFVRASVLAEVAIPLVHEPAEILSDDEIDDVVRDFQAFLDAAQPADFENEPPVDHEGAPEDDVGWGDDD